MSFGKLGIVSHGCEDLVAGRRTWRLASGSEARTPKTQDLKPTTEA
jgi:hypothetical protein